MFTRIKLAQFDFTIRNTKYDISVGKIVGDPENWSRVSAPNVEITIYFLLVFQKMAVEKNWCRNKTRCLLLDNSATSDKTQEREKRLR